MPSTWHTFLIHNLFRAFTHRSPTSQSQLTVQRWFSFAINSLRIGKLRVIERNHHWNNRCKVLRILPWILVIFLMDSLLILIASFNRRAILRMPSGRFRVWFFYCNLWGSDTNLSLWILRRIIMLRYFIVFYECLVMILLLITNRRMNFIFELIQVFRVTFFVSSSIVSSISFREWQVFLRQSFLGSGVMLWCSRRPLMF